MKVLFDRAVLEAQIPMSKKAKITIAVLVTALVALVAAFAIYVTYYAIGKKALPGTPIL